MSRVTTVRGGKLEVVKTVEDTRSYTAQDLVDQKDRLEAHISHAQAEISRLNTELTVVNADLFKLRG
jgi:hypothetical protein